MAQEIITVRMISMKDAVNKNYPTEDTDDYCDEEEIFMAHEEILRQQYCSQPLLIDPNQCEIELMKRTLHSLSLDQVKEEGDRSRYKPNQLYIKAINEVIHEKLYPNLPNRLAFFNEFVQLLQKTQDSDLKLVAQREHEFKLIVESIRGSKWRAQIIKVDGEVRWKCEWIGDARSFSCNHHELIQSNGVLFKQLVWKCITW